LAFYFHILNHYYIKTYRTQDLPTLHRYTGRFIMFSVITNIYNKKTKRTYLNGIVKSHNKTEKSFFLTTRDVRCAHHGWQGTHRYDIQVVATHASTCWRVSGKNLHMCAVSPVVHTSNIS